MAHDRVHGVKLASAISDTTYRIPWRASAGKLIPLLEQRRLSLRRHGCGQPQVGVGPGAGEAAAGGALNEALLHQEGLADVLDGIAGFGDGVAQRLDPGRPAAVVLDEAGEVAAVQGIEP